MFHVKLLIGSAANILFRHQLFVLCWDEIFLEYKNFSIARFALLDVHMACDVVFTIIKCYWYESLLTRFAKNPIKPFPYRQHNEQKWSANREWHGTINTTNTHDKLCKHAGRKLSCYVYDFIFWIWQFRT